MVSGRENRVSKELWVWGAQFVGCSTECGNSEDSGGLRTTAQTVGTVGTEGTVGTVGTEDHSTDCGDRGDSTECGDSGRQRGQLYD